jgi:transcriptional regulator with XRE-family HTH domain
MKASFIFSENLKRFRKIKDLTQAFVAESAGVTLQTIADIENGRRNPSLSVMESLATALGVSVYDLFLESAQVIQIGMAQVARRIRAIPDDVYEMAEQLEQTDKAWDTVRIALEVAIERTQSGKSSKKGNGEKP